MSTHATTLSRRLRTCLIGTAVILAPTLVLAQPANDTCATAQPLPGLPFSDNTIVANTANSGLPTPSCDSVTDPNGRFDVWYVITPPFDITFQYNETSAIDAFHAIYTGVCGALVQVHCTDADSGNFNMCAGVTYYVRVGFWSSTGSPTGNYVINFSQSGTPPPPPAPNDACFTATNIPPSPLPYSNTVDGRTNCARDDDSTCNASGPTETRNGVWYTFTPLVTQNYILSETSSNDTVRAVYIAVDPNFGCAGLMQIRCDDAESATFVMSAGVTHYILCGMFSSTTNPSGPYTITLDTPPPPPANDECSGALAIECGSSATVNNTNATTAPSDPNFACSGNLQRFKSTWYTFVATSSGATIDTEGSVVTDTVLHVLSGTCGGLTVIGCDDDSGTGLLSTVTLGSLTPGTTYYIEVANFSSSAGGNIKVNVSCVPPPPPPVNDVCSGAVAIACGSSATVDNTYATTDANDPTFACRVGGAAQGARSLWFSFVAGGPGATINTEGSVVTDTMLQVFSGDCGSLASISCDDDGGTGLLSSITVGGLTAGSTYYIEAANWSPSTTPGNITVNVACLPVGVEVARVYFANQQSQTGAVQICVMLDPNLPQGPQFANLPAGAPAIYVNCVITTDPNLPPLWAIQNVPLPIVKSTTDADNVIDLDTFFEMPFSFPPLGTLTCYLSNDVCTGTFPPTGLLDTFGPSTYSLGRVDQLFSNGGGRGPAPTPVPGLFTSPLQLPHTVLPIFDDFKLRLNVPDYDQDQNDADVDTDTPPDGIAEDNRGHDECAPTSTANSMRWLGDTYGLNGSLPAKTPGGATEDDDLITELAEDMDTNRLRTGNGTAGSGTEDADMVNGKLKFIRDHGLPLVVEFKDGDTVINGQPTDPPDPMWIWRQLEKGQDVELGFSFVGGGGHWVTLTGGIHWSDGTYGVYVNDPDDGKTGKEKTAYYNLGTREVGGETYLEMLGYGAAHYIDIAVAESPKGPGDVDGDNDVDQDDMDIILFNFDTGGHPPYHDGDLDGDGDVDQDDLDQVLFFFGADYH